MHNQQIRFLTNGSVHGIEREVHGRGHTPHVAARVPELEPVQGGIVVGHLVRSQLRVHVANDLVELRHC